MVISFKKWASEYLDGNGGVKIRIAALEKQVDGSADPFHDRGASRDGFSSWGEAGGV
jgi:hypothetical protein